MNYFAYGSNMDVHQMADRCPGARVVSTAKLPDYRFIINSRGVASIVDAPGDMVHGVLWEISRANEQALDRYEGVHRGLYSKKGMAVETGVGSAENALTFAATDSNVGRPRRGYMERIVMAAKAHELPNEYVAELEGWTSRT